jgi:hypothetical protein
MPRWAAGDAAYGVFAGRCPVQGVQVARGLCGWCAGPVPFAVVMRMVPCSVWRWGRSAEGDSGQMPLITAIDCLAGDRDWFLISRIYRWRGSGCEWLWNMKTFVQAFEFAGGDWGWRICPVSADRGLAPTRTQARVRVRGAGVCLGLSGGRRWWRVPRAGRVRVPPRTTWTR